jgi:hypothetical protein
LALTARRTACDVAQANTTRRGALSMRAGL